MKSLENVTSVAIYVSAMCIMLSKHQKTKEMFYYGIIREEDSFNLKSMSMYYFKYV